MAETPESTDFVCVLECQPGDHPKTGLPHRLTKTFKADGSHTSYQGSFLYRAEHVPVSSLVELADLLAALASEPCMCIIRDQRLPNADGVTDEWVPRRASEVKYGEGNVAFAAASHHWVAIDLDASVIALDPKDPRASIAEWRATLPPPLNTCGMVFHLSSKAHVSPYLRGHAWIWATEPVDQATLKAWYPCVTDDPALSHPIQIHYTADPVFEDGAGPDPYAGRRMHVFEGPDAAIDWSAVDVSAVTPRKHSNGLNGAPDVPADADVLEVLGAAADHEGRRWHLCGALGGVWRKLFRSAEWAEAQIRAWLAPLEGQGCDVQAGVDRCLGAWAIMPWECTGAGELATLLGDRAWADRIAHASTAPARRKPTPEGGGDFTPVVSTLVGDLEQPLTLQGPNSTMWVRTEEGYHGPVAVKRMRSLTRSLGLFELVCCRSDGPGVLSYDTIYDQGTFVDKVVRDFSDVRTWFDPDVAELHQGYELPPIEGVYDADVEAWLTALCGDMLPNVLEWIVACKQEHISQRAAALVMVGPPGIGKTKIFEAVAGLWGSTFVPLADSIAQFNGTITRCPIVLDDECAALKSKKVTSAEFRQRVQADRRDFELKGKEKVELRGCTREGITANDLDEVRFTDVRGPDVAKALADRLCVVVAADPEGAHAALMRIRGDGGSAGEMARMVGHLAWIWATATAPASARFIGAGGVAAQRIALGAVADAGAPLWESLRQWVEGDPPDVCEAKPTDIPASGWLHHRERILANPAMLAQLLALKSPGWDVGMVQKMLRPVCVGVDRVETSMGRTRWWIIEYARVRPLLGED